MNRVDKKILNALQYEFEISSRPYLKLAEKLGLSEDDLIERIQRMKKDKMIRRFGVSFNSRKLGYITTLVAASVAPDKIEAVAKVINSYVEVTHNYERDNDTFNIWFTVIARNKDRLQEILTNVEAQEGVNTLKNLPSKKIFKTNVRFKLGK